MSVGSVAMHLNLSRFLSLKNFLTKSHLSKNSNSSFNHKSERDRHFAVSNKNEDQVSFNRLNLNY